MIAEHSRLPPSSAARRMQCPGSRALCEQYPEPKDSPKALEGTMAHALNLTVFTGQPYLPTIAPSEEMLDGAELWCQTIEPYRDKVVLETPVSCESIHPDCWGTPDAWVVEDGVLRVWDYKYGHKIVDAFENWQLLEYAIGVTGLAVKKVELTVVQPRAYHRDGPVRTWSLSAESLEDYRLQLVESESAAMEDDAPLRVGPECLYCPARHVCTTLQDAVYTGADYAQEATPEPLGEVALGRELALLTDMVVLMESRISGLTQEALARGGVPGWIIERGTGRKRWSHPIAEVIALGEMMGIDIAKPGALTPAQAIKAGLAAELVNSYTETPVGELKLVRDNGKAARVAFGDK